MPHTFLSRFAIHPDKDAEFVELTKAAEEVAAREPDTLAYKFYRRDGDGAFAVYESFTDAAADEAHQANPEMQPIIEKMMVCIDGGYEREYLHDV